MQWLEAIGLSVLLVAPGLMLIVVGRMSGNGTLRRNHMVGLRTRTTLASDAAWFAGQRAGAGAVTAAGAIGCVAGLALLLMRPGDLGFAVLVIGGNVTMLVLVIVGAVKGQRAAAAVVDDPDDA